MLCEVEYNPNRLSTALGWIENSSNYGWMDGVVSEKRFTEPLICLRLTVLKLFTGTGHHSPTASTEWTRRLIIHMLIPFVYAMSGTRDRSDIKPDEGLAHSR